MKVFFDDVADMLGTPDKLCVLVWSEFGRRIQQNSNGTDHGSQGADVRDRRRRFHGGVYGNHPNIAEAAWDDEGNTELPQDAQRRASARPTSATSTAPS